MGAELNNEEKAIKKSDRIPKECREYISHHVRNGLVSILGTAMKFSERQEDIREIEDHVTHIVEDLKKVGL
jgi:hypothetical protein